MASNLDLYFGLNEREREILKTACNAGDNPMTRQMIKLYLPKISDVETTEFIKNVRALPT